MQTVHIAQLREQARLYNIQLSYEDAAGKKRNASRESLEAIVRLRSRGRDLREEHVVEPVTVVWGRSRLRVPVRLPDGSVEWDLQFEDGSTRSGRADVTGGVLTLDPVTHGYHVLRVRNVETFVIAAPVRAHAPKEKSWGVFAPLYSIRTERSWGAGDLGDMNAYRAWVNELGGGVVATLPMLAVDTEGDPSPYSPLSRLFWNEMYLDIERVPEFDPSDRDDAAIAALQNTDRVDYAGVMREKRRVLERMCRRYSGELPDDARDYAQWRAARDSKTTERYHRYVQMRIAQQMRDLASEAKRSGLGLYLDFPLGVNPNGYDAHRFSRAFAKGVSVGAPPDLFFTKGQNWGFPPFDPDAIREQRYDYFRACIQHHASHAGILRMDHVMGLHRLFWIPEGMEPKDGVYVRYPEDELYAVLVLESNRHGCAIVGEDLGTVPEYVPQIMNKRGLRRMYVVQYEAKPESGEPINTPATESVASVNTHDMPTFTGFWGGRDIDDRVAQKLLDERGAREERQKRQQLRDAITQYLKAQGLLQDDTDETGPILTALLAFLAKSSAEIVLINLEDLWLETDPQNVPGVPERSWRQKFMFTLEHIRRDERIAAILRSVSEQRREVDGNAT